MAPAQPDQDRTLGVEGKPKFDEKGLTLKDGLGRDEEGPLPRCRTGGDTKEKKKSDEGKTADQGGSSLRKWTVLLPLKPDLGRTMMIQTA